MSEDFFQRYDGASAPSADAHGAPRAIIDIGSNSIRLVVWRDGSRVPAVMFNEKRMAGLGAALAQDNRLSEEAMDVAQETLARFLEVARQIGVGSLRAVATAAVRDASNGEELVERIQRCSGLSIDVLTGDEEAAASAYGVIAGIPGADGIVGDLGGGSLELIRVSNGRIGSRISLPIGSLRLAELRARGSRSLDRLLHRLLEDQQWISQGQGKPFYAVGGSWRALAQVHMDLCEHPLPMIHQYRFPAQAMSPLVRALAQISTKRLKKVAGLSSSRIPTLSGAAALLSAVLRRLGSSEVVISGWGLREGLLYQNMTPEQRARDPLIDAARAEGEREGRFPGQGDRLHQWIAPLFADEGPEVERLRHAACLLADVAWRAHPDFRPDRGLEFALHGNWVGIDGFGRAMLGAALFANFGGAANHPARGLLGGLADDASLDRARQWGLAMRLALRISGGAAQVLNGIGLSRSGDMLIMSLPAERRALYGEAVSRRHKALASALGLSPRLTIIG